MSLSGARSGTVEAGILRGSDGLVGEIEVGWLTVTEIDEDGRIVRVMSFNPDDVEAAVAEIHARAVVLHAGAPTLISFASRHGARF